MLITRVRRDFPPYTPEVSAHPFPELPQSWSVEEEWGDVSDYRVVPFVIGWPRRIDGKWHRPGTACYALQHMYRFENPPSFWTTVRCSFDPLRLVR
jgi:hypothetical protein